MIEADITNSLVKGLELLPACWIYKIDNSARGQVKPCDLLGSMNAQPFAIEVKLYKSPRSFEELQNSDRCLITNKDFRPTQIPSLNKMISRRMTPFIVLGVHDSTQLKTRAWIFRYTRYVAMECALTLNHLLAGPPYLELLRPKGNWTPPEDWYARAY